MSRLDRLKEYAKPNSGPKGATHGRQDRVDYWSNWATENSAIAPRASDGPMQLPDTGKVKLHSTKSSPRTLAEIDRHMARKDDLNHVAVGGSDYMKSVRRS
jgi:hypothetical protein